TRRIGDLDGVALIQISCRASRVGPESRICQSAPNAVIGVSGPDRGCIGSVRDGLLDELAHGRAGARAKDSLGHAIARHNLHGTAQTVKSGRSRPRTRLHGNGWWI